MEIKEQVAPEISRCSAFIIDDRTQAQKAWPGENGKERGNRK